MFVVIKSRQQTSTVWWDSSSSTECPISIDDNMFSIYKRTALRLLVENSINNVYPTASYFTPSSSIKSEILFLYQENVVPGASKSFSRRREHSSWADSLERLMSRVRSLSWGWFGWWTSSSSGLYESCSAAILDWESEVSSICMVTFGSGSGELELWGTGFEIDGTSEYITWCLFLRF